MKKLLKVLTSKATIIGLLTLLQFAVFIVGIIYLDDKFAFFTYISYGLSIILILFILRSDEIATYKLSWIIPIIIAPVFGGLFYLTFKPLTQTRKLARRALKNDGYRKEQTIKDIKEIPNIEPEYQKQTTYLNKEGWAHYHNTQTVFLPSGESKLSYVLNALQKAEKFIFLDYFILEETGLTWASIFPILKEKAEAGLDVRVIYDDFGSSTRIKRGFRKRLKAASIDVVNFNPLKLRFVVALNYRSHKKMIIIDGNVGFTGGINIADEYINLKKRFGHWHDAAIMLKGDAVFGLTASFLESWDLHKGTQTDYSLFKPTIREKSDGIVLPFSDSPVNKNFLSINLYNQMIFSAKKEIYITTPYFIIDNNLLNALKLQALGGVKIHIIVPSIPDKKFAYIVTKYYLKQLINVPNVYIYSYTPGFIHSKILYVDGKICSIGTVNFDYRSFYLHVENTVWLYENSAIKEIKSFLDKTTSDSRLMTYDELYKRNVFYKLYESFLLLFAHLF